ncbi:unnamed protein product [Caenorhabditis sp. 36 PRJEB53466]|nr:unnamed protein product [Caenorhabditis sp. 36 PRJEB53466]
MSEEELSQHLVDVLRVTEECLDRGRFSFKYISDHLDAISEVGAIIQTLDPYENVFTIEVVDALKYVLKELFEFMQLHCDDLIAFKEDSNEYTEIAETAMNLLEKMITSLSTPGEINEQFVAVCEETSPAEYGKKLLDLLESDEENPLNVAFAEDPEMTLEFIKWENIINGVLAQFLFIEAYASGLVKYGDTEETNDLNARIGEFKEKWDAERGYAEGEEGQSEEEEEEEEEEGDGDDQQRGQHDEEEEQEEEQEGDQEDKVEEEEESEEENEDQQ